MISRQEEVIRSAIHGKLAEVSPNATQNVLLEETQELSSLTLCLRLSIL